jgi:hypothetical protein
MLSAFSREARRADAREQHDIIERAIQGEKLWALREQEMATGLSASMFSCFGQRDGPRFN